jgi:predicted Zn finger-like uncharacterized protein
VARRSGRFNRHAPPVSQTLGEHRRDCYNIGDIAAGHGGAEAMAMRLICPNCDAEYEVDDSAIPETGRDVQCSNCGHGWFQLRPGDEADAGEGDADLAFDADADADDPGDGGAPPAPRRAPVADRDDDADDADDAPAGPPPPLRRSVDASVLAVLRDEAEREARARAADRQAQARPVETQTELALPATPPRIPVARAPEPAVAEAGAGEARAGDAAEAGAGAGAGRETRRDLLPDIEQINFSLKANAARGGSGAEAMPAPPDEAPAGGLLRGFVWVIAVAAVLAALYLLAPALSRTAPPLEPALSGYVAGVDGARAWLAGLMGR